MAGAANLADPWEAHGIGAWWGNCAGSIGTVERTIDAAYEGSEPIRMSLDGGRVWLILGFSASAGTPRTYYVDAVHVSLHYA